MPVHAHHGEIGERVAEGGQFPVHHGDNACRVVRVQDGVVDTVVTVDDRRSGRFRNRLGERGVQPFEIRQFPGLHPAPLARPQLHLPGHVAVRPAQSPEADGLEVDIVQFGDDAHEFTDTAVDLVVAERIQVGLAAHHTSVDELDDGERRTHHRVVLALGDGGRDRHTGALERRRDAELAGDVVRRRGQTRGRRATQHPVGLLVEQPVGEVGLAARDELRPKFTLNGHAGIGEEALEDGEVESLVYGGHFAASRAALRTAPTARLAMAQR